MGMNPNSSKGFTVKAIVREQVLDRSESKETSWSVSTPKPSIRTSCLGKVIVFREGQDR